MTFIKLKPAYKDYLWGGQKLKESYHKESQAERIAESWEVSVRQGSESIVAQGTYDGETLSNYLIKRGKKALGSFSENEFPLLIKLIDATQALSLQVHPDDAYALENEQQSGKLELWYILKAAEDAYIDYGFKQAVSKEDVIAALENRNLTALLKRIKVKQGEVYRIEPGTVHALGSGTLILEIQENSDCTYRLYDYERIDAKGNKRELQVAKALAVLDFNKHSLHALPTKLLAENSHYKRILLDDNRYFKAELYQVNDQLKLETLEDSFTVALVLEGSFISSDSIASNALAKGETLFIEADSEAVSFKGKGEIVIVTPNVVRAVNK